MMFLMRRSKRSIVKLNLQDMSHALIQDPTAISHQYSRAMKLAHTVTVRTIQLFLNDMSLWLELPQPLPQCPTAEFHFSHEAITPDSWHGTAM